VHQPGNIWAVAEGAGAIENLFAEDTRQRRICLAAEICRPEATSSRSFPILTAAVLAGLLEQSQTHGQTAALAAFRRWLRKESV